MTEIAKPSKTCFVVGPIGSAGHSTRTHADWLLKAIIRPVFLESFPEFRVVRADDINAPGMIDSQIITALLDSELVIADMSELNANAFYEIGIRHMAQKPIIHMFLKGHQIPFDVKPFRAIEFARDEFDDLLRAKEAVKLAVAEVIGPDFVVENPITRARGAVNIAEHSTPEIKLIWEQVQDLQKSFGSLNKTQKYRSTGGVMPLDYYLAAKLSPNITENERKTIIEKLIAYKEALYPGAQEYPHPDFDFQFQLPYTISEENDKRFKGLAELLGVELTTHVG